MRHDAATIGTDGVIRSGTDIARETAATLAQSFRDMAGQCEDIAANLDRIARHPRTSIAGDIDGFVDYLAEWMRDATDATCTLTADIGNTADDSADGFLPVDVCPDCLTVAANGAGETSPEHLARYIAAQDREESHYGNGTELVASCPDIYGDCRNDDGECTSGDRFSKNPCEWCGDTLAGHRIHAAIRRADWQ